MESTCKLQAAEMVYSEALAAADKQRATDLDRAAQLHNEAHTAAWEMFYAARAAALKTVEEARAAAASSDARGSELLRSLDRSRARL